MKEKKSWYLVVPYSEWSPLGRKENKPDVASCVNSYEMKSEWLRWENVECIHPNTIETDEVPMVQQIFPICMLYFTERLGLN